MVFILPRFVPVSVHDNLRDSQPLDFILNYADTSILNAMTSARCDRSLPVDTSLTEFWWYTTSFSACSLGDEPIFSFDGLWF